MTVRQLYFIIVQTTWAFQSNKHIFIECHYVSVALINKSIVDSKPAFFSLQELLIKLWRKAIIKITITLAMNIYCLLDALHVFLTIIQIYYKLLSHFHKEEMKSQGGYVTNLSNQILYRIQSQVI